VSFGGSTKDFMRKEISKLDESVVRRQYPLAHLLPGWFFRLEEQSAGHYVAEGTDLWGRLVSVSGGEEALTRAVEAAQDIERRSRT
jgi:hypothetical protein